MRISNPLLLTSSLYLTVYAQNSDQPGYDCHPHCINPTIPVSNDTFSFGRHYAVLNLDLVNFVIDGIANTTAGKAFIHSTAKWIDLVHKQDPPPLSIFTRVYYSNARRPETREGIPWSELGVDVGGENDPSTQINSAFNVDEKAGDVVLQKTRYYAGAGNSLEQILSTQQIDTVILSGLATSGVMLSTAYQLFDLNYNIYVIANNTIQSGAGGQLINTAILENIMPRLPVNVITIEQAKAALKRSGPAIY